VSEPVQQDFEVFDWESVLKAAAEFQQIAPGGVLVGGSAAAIYATHRFSRDADHVYQDLEVRFDRLLEFLEQRGDWETARVNPPKLILGNFRGVETGLRQLRRTLPLEVASVRVGDASLLLPTPAEILRIKGWLIIDRNAVRDYVDFAALAHWLGSERTATALVEFDRYYEDIYRPKGDRDVSPGLQLARQLADPKPKDLGDVDLKRYKGLKPPWDDWESVRFQCQGASILLLDALIDAEQDQEPEESSSLDPSPT
jgi:hypothetical protein